MENDRNQVQDGNYLLWQADMLAFGRLTELPQILEQIGGIALQAYEAREEQDGTTVRELPTATDSRFVVEKDSEEVEQPIESPETEGAEMQPDNTETEEQPKEEVEPTETEEAPATEDETAADEQPEAEAEAEQETEEETTTTNEETEA